MLQRQTLITTLAFLFLFGCANTDKAEEKAGEYAKHNYPNDKVVNIECEVSDDDGNGRVRCNISLESPSGETHTEGVECPSGWGPQPTKTLCVVPKP